LDLGHAVKPPVIGREGADFGLAHLGHTESIFKINGGLGIKSQSQEGDLASRSLQAGDGEDRGERESPHG
jgi:hypothetical protein